MALSQEQAEQIRQRFLEQIEKLPAEQRGELREQVMNATPEQLEGALGSKDGNPGGEEECLFCGIAKGKVETFKLYEDSNVIAFLDINPSVAGQAIIIPKEHYQFIFQIPDQVLWSIFKVVKMIEPLIVNATKSGGVSIYISQGNAAGQYFKHLAVNIIPRFSDDKAAFYWQRNDAKKEDLEKVSRTLREGMEKMVKEERDRIEKAVKERQRAEKKQETGEKLPELSRRKP